MRKRVRRAVLYTALAAGGVALARHQVHRLTRKDPALTQFVMEEAYRKYNQDIRANNRHRK